MSKSDKNYKDTNNFLNSLQEDENFKKFVIENYSYDGVCHWQFFPSYVWPYFFFCIECANILDDLIKNHQITKLEYTKNDSIYSSIFYHLLVDFCKKNNINLKTSSEKSSISLQFFKRILGGLYRSIEFLVLLIRFKSKSPMPQKSENNILIFSQALYLDNIQGKLIDRQVGTLYKGLLQNFTPTLIFSGINDLFPLLKENKKNCLNYNYFCYFADPIVFIKFKLSNRIRLYKSKNRSELNDIYYKEVNIKKSVNTIFDCIKNNIFKETIFCRVTTRRLLDKLKPHAIYLTYETGPVQRAAIIEAARKKIPTYGLQHGIIFSNHYDYMHSVVTQNYGEFGFHIPNKTFVWGEFWKNILINSGKYPIDSVVVSGSWKNQRSATLTIKKPEDKKGILILTHGIRSDYFISTIRNITNNFGSCTLFYRPHPSEKENVKALDLKNFQLLTDGSLESALEKADIVIAPTSTVILDAIYAKKITILFDHTAEKGWEDFKIIEGCFYTETAEDLEKTLKRLINLPADELLDLKKKLEKSSQEFYEGDQKSALQKILLPLKT